MKSYTDLEQGRKLSEILPLEGADMWYQHIGWEHLSDNSEKPLYLPMVIMDSKSDIDIPCWSLAALLSVIPQEVFDGEYIINITEGCDYKWVLSYDHYENRKISYYGLSTAADNLVDACYEMILKLYERKML